MAYRLTALRRSWAISSARWASLRMRDAYQIALKKDRRKKDYHNIVQMKMDALRRPDEPEV